MHYINETPTACKDAFSDHAEAHLIRQTAHCAHRIVHMVNL